jgi:2-hydroxychromene-2-carboxylate isomerase
MRLEYVFDYPSPYAFLAGTQLERLGIEADHTPIDILTVARTASRPSSTDRTKAHSTIALARRWAARRGIALQINWPLMTAAMSGRFEWQVLTRGALVARNIGLLAAYNAAVFRAIWSEPDDLISESGRRTVLQRAGIDVPGLSERASSAETAAQLDANN